VKTRNGLWFSLLAALLMVVFAAGALSGPQRFPSEETAAATWTQGALHVVRRDKPACCWE